MKKKVEEPKKGTDGVELLIVMGLLIAFVLFCWKVVGFALASPEVLK